MALATQAMLEKFLQIDVTSEPSAPVTMLLENASGLVEAYLGRRLEFASYTETYDPPAGTILHLRQGPVDQSSNAVTVTEDGTALVLGTDFFVYEKRGYIMRTNSDGTPRRWAAFTRKYQSIVVTYDAGFDMTADPMTEPQALVARDTTVRIVARAWQAAAAYANLPKAADALKSVTLAGSDSVTYRDEIVNVASSAVQLTVEDKFALDSIRRRVLA